MRNHTARLPQVSDSIACLGGRRRFFFKAAPDHLKLVANEIPVSQDIDHSRDQQSVFQSCRYHRAYVAEGGSAALLFGLRMVDFGAAALGGGFLCCFLQTTRYPHTRFFDVPRRR